jgi:hypothetical protein
MRLPLLRIWLKDDLRLNWLWCNLHVSQRSYHVFMVRNSLLNVMLLLMLNVLDHVLSISLSSKHLSLVLALLLLLIDDLLAKSRMVLLASLLALREELGLLLLLIVLHEHATRFKWLLNSLLLLYHLSIVSLLLRR